jgi:carbonic anhydrase
MLAMNTKRRFTHPNLLNFSARSVNFEDPEPEIPNLLNLSCDRAIDFLIKGNQKYVELRTKGIGCGSVRLSAVAQGQKPFAAVLNYANLPSSIEEVFNQKFGDLFAINAPGSKIERQDISSIEYGVLMLGIKTVIVLGNNNEDRDSLQPIERHSITYRVNDLQLEIAQNRIFLSSSRQCQARTDISSRVDRLKASPLVRQLVDTGELKIVGGLYDDRTGLVTIL